MDPFVGLAIYVLLLLLLIFTLIFGQSSLCDKTPLPRVHFFITEGFCDVAEAAARRFCGRRGTALCHSAGELCFERSNPVVQILFVVLLAACYWAAWSYLFPMLPLPGIPAWHKHTGTAGALLCLALFLAASFSDPGTVTAANVAAHRALYPCDGLLYEEKECRTCGLPRPARSKHCSACGRCVARLDHHCIWINRCVGLANMRWFLAFLAATAAICCYAAVLGARVLLADLAQQDTWNTAFIHPETGQLVYLSDSWHFLLHFLSAMYGPQARRSPRPAPHPARQAAPLGLPPPASRMPATPAPPCGRAVGGCGGAKRPGSPSLYPSNSTLPAETCPRAGQKMALTFFTAVAGWIVAGFLGYQLYLICAGLTTVEMHKRRVVALALELEEEQRQVEARVERQLARGDGSGGAAAAGGREQPARQRPARAAQPQARRGRPPSLPHRYDRGAWLNLREVLFPHHHLRLAAAAAGAPSGQGASGSGGDGSKKQA
ncbi:hypothetical protein CHLNCDRAFT_57008 [Chlorella variabilis]|uniref:S-acyltransferase n=1 Tax=Chlorella variabilis TaxID=554065 RepID=E1Z7A2_CHLVA|nr:hypothetical protein CHLNCDRAFT_57008 [Chlorella variabilis]EFN58137.1 hypothetical protein CHLNCDRAFT_57008 [Chlorella variabilis]|eukprot:XP_005850239.1 hypothetical protein CHLNCDRAFT_57008 [Chlorella variabilis]